MQVMMDEVWFDEGGTVVHMCKKPAKSRNFGHREKFVLSGRD